MATYQRKEQEQGREDEGRECIGHHCGGPLLRLSELVLTREDTSQSFRKRPSQPGPNANNCGEETPPRDQAFDWLYATSLIPGVSLPRTLFWFQPVYG